jgi:hypothetical protein
MTPPESTAEPVMTAAWWTASITTLILAVTAVLGALNVWHPSDEQVTAFTAAGAAVVAVVFPLVAFFVRKRVTPVQKES